MHLKYCSLEYLKLLDVGTTSVPCMARIAALLLCRFGHVQLQLQLPGNLVMRVVCDDLLRESP